MVHLLLMFLVGPLTYEKAYERSKITNHLVVLIEGENCPACVVQERNLRLAEIDYHKTHDVSRWPGLPALRPITLWYWREGKEWKLELLRGSIDVERLKAIKKQRAKVDM